MDRVRFLSDMISESRIGFNYYERAMRDMIDAYLLRMNPDQYKWLEERAKSRLYFPKLNAKAKRITDSLTETYFNSDKFAKLGEYINTDPKIMEKWQNAIDHYTEMINMYKTFNPIFLKAPFMPLSVVKVYWYNDLAQIDEVNIDDIFFDPSAETSDDVRYIVNRVRMTKGDMEMMQKAGIYSNKSNINDFVTEVKPYERFEVYDIYYRTAEGWELSTIYNEAEILRDKQKLKDGQPFVWGYMLPQIRDIEESNFVAVYGEAPLASMLPLQEELNSTRNQMIDAMKQHLAPKLIMPKSSGISRLDLETPSKPIFTSAPAGITIVPPANIQSAQANIMQIDMEASEVSGVSPQNNGVAPQRKETATQASIMANEGSVRIQGYVRTYNETFFEPIFEKIAMLVWKYGDATFFTGIDRKEVPSFKVSLNTGIGALNKEIQKQGLSEAYQMLTGQMQAHMALQDMEGATKMLKASSKVIRDLLPLYGIKNIEDYIGKEEDEINIRNAEVGGFGAPSPIQPKNGGAIQAPSL